MVKKYYLSIIYIVTVLLTVSMILSSCGRKGDLVLSQDEKMTQTIVRDVD